MAHIGPKWVKKGQNGQKGPIGTHSGQYWPKGLRALLRVHGFWAWARMAQPSITDNTGPDRSVRWPISRTSLIKPGPLLTGLARMGPKWPKWVKMAHFDPLWPKWAIPDGWEPQI